MPRGSSGKPNLASSAAALRSNGRAGAKPPASAAPLTAAATGRVHSPTASNAVVLVSTRRRLCSASPPELRHVHSRAERRTCAGEDDAAHRLVGGERAEGLAKLDAELDRQRVALLGALQGDQRDLATALDRQQACHAMMLSRQTRGCLGAWRAGREI